MRDKITADHVIESYLLATENRPLWSHKYTLARFMRRFPEHAQDLIEFTALEALIESRENKFAHSENSC